MTTPSNAMTTRSIVLSMSSRINNDRTKGCMHLRSSSEKTAPERESQSKRTALVSDESDRAQGRMCLRSASRETAAVIGSKSKHNVTFRGSPNRSVDANGDTEDDNDKKDGKDPNDDDFEVADGEDYDLDNSDDSDGCSSKDNIDQGSDDISSTEDDDDSNNADQIQIQWREEKFAADTQARFREKYQKLTEWVQQYATEFWPLQYPFSEELCVLYVRNEMKRRKKDGSLLGSGHLYQITQMLYYEGFTKHGHMVPATLQENLHNALSVHKREIARRISQGKQCQADSHAQNASWTAVEFCAKKLHNWRPERGQDPRTHLFFLLSVQSLSRGERVGKILHDAFGEGIGGDHISAGKGMTSKTDQTGIRSYNKRFVPNASNPHLCVVTALGRHLLSYRPEEVSKYVFMNKKEAKHYEKLLRKQRLAKKTNKRHSKRAKRSRNIGPHKKFDRLIKKVFEPLTTAELLSKGLSTTKKFVGHCKKKAGFAKAAEVDGIDAAMVGTRAEHCTGNYTTYASRSILGVQNSGGPPARSDVSMAKALAGLQQYTADFNAVPPHWEKIIVDRIPFSDLIPCYDNLPAGMQAIVPLALAQVVYHYHRSPQGLSKQHALFRSPLWTSHQNYRDQLYSALCGADTGRTPSLKPLYRDKLTQQYLWTENINDASTIILQNTQKAIHIATEAYKISRDNQATLKRIERQLQPDCHKESDDQGVRDNRFANQHTSDSHHENSVDCTVESTITANPAAKVSAARNVNNMHDGEEFSQRFNSDQSTLSIESIDVETAWHCWHGSGGASPWRIITRKSHCLPCEPEEKRRVLQSISKIRKLVAFIQGKTPDIDIDSNVSHAWNECKLNAIKVLAGHPFNINEWPFSGSFRYAYDSLTRIQKQHSKAAEDCYERQVFVTPMPKPMIKQLPITDFLKKMEKSEMDEEDIDIDDAENQSEGNNDDTSNYAASFPDSSSVRGKVNPTQDCYICPSCSDSESQWAVYKTTKTLWQHWDDKHRDEIRPALWRVQLVSGMKLEDRRSASWVRVPNAKSFFCSEYTIYKMREDILARGYVQNGAIIEIQPPKSESMSGIRWFGVVRDGRVRDQGILVQYCINDSHKLPHDDAAHAQRVHVQNIIKVCKDSAQCTPPGRPKSPTSTIQFGSTPHKRNHDNSQVLMVASSPKSPLQRQKAGKPSPPCTPPKSQDQKREYATSKLERQPATTNTIQYGSTPHKRNHDSSQALIVASSPKNSLQRQKAGQPSPPCIPPKSQDQKREYATSKLERQPASTPEKQPASTPENRTHAESALTISEHEILHNDICDRLQTCICRSLSGTKHIVGALRQFTEASTNVLLQGWTRCITIENGNQNYNLQHKKYKVSFVPRDGNCLFHCFSHFVNKRNFSAVRSSQKTIRQTLWEYVKAQESPTFSKYGGLVVGEISYPCEESLLTSYGGEIAIYAFVKKFNIPIEVHSPENGKVRRYPIDGQDNELDLANWTKDSGAEVILQTNGWQNWSRYTGERRWSGDHWQIIEPQSHAGNKMLLSQTLEGSVSRGSAATTTLKTRDASDEKLLGRKLDFQNCDARQLKFVEKEASCTLRKVVEHSTLQEQKQHPHLHIQLMQRAVCSNNPFIIPSFKPPTWEPGGYLPRITIEQVTFVQHNYGNRFSKMYPHEVIRILTSFPELDELHRSFFLVMGLATKKDPFRLQCLFRLQAQRLKARGEVLADRTLNVSQRVDFRILSWCWPTEFDDFSILVIDESSEENLQSRFLYESNSITTARKSIFLHRNVEGTYILLYPVDHTDVTTLRPSTSQQFLHERDPSLRCPSLIDFDVYRDDTSFVTAALHGFEPSKNDMKAIWRDAITYCGLEMDEDSGKWTKFPVGSSLQKKPPAQNANETEGSMNVESWGLVKDKLLQAYFSSSCDDGSTSAVHMPNRLTRAQMRSPPRTVTVPTASTPHTSCMFLDAGSEAGVGLFNMMIDNHILHVAGVEIQTAWFQISANIFQFVRTSFQKRGFRMPQVTILNSCMLAQTRELKWLYSCASIVWMNNFAFDKQEHFKSIRDSSHAKHTSRALVPGNPYLSSNAAYNFSRNFQGTTFVAVFLPERFQSDWNFKKFKPFLVRTTWSETPVNVSIIRHTQHIDLCRNTSLGHCSDSDASLFDTKMHQWSSLVSECPDIHNAIMTETMPTPLALGYFITSLSPTSWVSSVVIEEYISLVARQLPDTFFHFTFDHALDRLIQEPRRTGNFNYDKWKDFKEHNKICFCFNVSGVHYISAKIDKTTSSIAVAETLDFPNDEIIRKLNVFATKVGCKGPMNVFRLKMPNQKNSFDCGPLSCLSLLFMAQNVITPDSELQYATESCARMMRLRIFSDLMKGHATLLKQ